MSNYIDEERYIRAKKRVEKIKGFYIHLAVYIIVNLFILGVKFIDDYKDGDNFWEFGSFGTVFFWGIGLAVHAISVFGFGFVFGKNWEERKLKQFMDEEKGERQRWE
ncbi:MAG: 2TM domain-containing protein [Flavobacteriaceae bacterium]|nr:2TM domain-containing protein [Flavobacteriaceae bacterium]